MDLSTQTPLQIDTRLSDLYDQFATAARRKTWESESLHEAAGDKLTSSRWAKTKVWAMTDDEAAEKVAAIATTDQTWRGSQAKGALTKYEDAAEQVDIILAEISALNAEYRRRPWTRAFLVQASNGHVHSSMDCSTCYPTTQYAWMVSYAAKDESEIIEAAGEKACTICYPNAPVDVLKRPTKMFGPEQIAANAAREERAAAKVARDAKKIANGLTADGSEFVVEYVEHNAPGWGPRDAKGIQVHEYKDRVKREWFKTEKAAVMWVVQYMSWDHGMDSDMGAGYQQVIEAVAAKHGKTTTEVQAEIAAKVAAKRKRDNRGY